jgi:aldose 1-epimerase
MSITKKSFGKLSDGREVSVYEMTSEKGLRVNISDYGCAIISLLVPDKDGKLRDVVTGFDDLKPYTGPNPFFGVVCGRVANRINGGKFVLDGKEYQLEKNDHGNHHLHGGSNGFNGKLWDAKVSENSLILTLHSPDGDSGYPGALTAQVTYSLSSENCLRIDYMAETDTKTICNLTNHSYFNLEGHDAKDIYGQEMQINAKQITTVDSTLIPTGGFTDVVGTPYDFTKPKALGADIANAGLGYDDNFVLDGSGTAAIVSSPESGIRMTVKTDCPGIQLYTGNFLDGSHKGKGGVYYQKHSAFCLETQIFPDAINHPNFPTCIIEKDKPQKYFTEFVFSLV